MVSNSGVQDGFAPVLLTYGHAGEPDRTFNANGQLSRIPRLSSLQFAKWQMEHGQVVDIRPQAGVLHIDSHQRAI